MRMNGVSVTSMTAMLPNGAPRIMATPGGARA